MHDTFGLDQAQLVADGRLKQSLAYFRIAKLGQDRMPYAGSNVLDTEGTDLLCRWIKGRSPAKTTSRITRAARITLCVAMAVGEPSHRHEERDRRSRRLCTEVNQRND